MYDYAHDDVSIADTDQLYRRVPPTQAPYNPNRKRRWPSSASLLPARGDNEVSVYLGSVLKDLGLEAIDVIEGHDDYGLVWFPAVAAREAGYKIQHDPELDNDRPLRVDPAHAVLLCDPPTTKGYRKHARDLQDDERFIVVRDPVGGLENG